MKVTQKNNNNALGETNKSRNFWIIKEKKNIISGSNSNILFSDLEEDFKNLKLILFENKKCNDEDNNFLNTENSFKKFNTNKKFLRVITINYDINKPNNLEAVIFIWFKHDEIKSNFYLIIINFNKFKMVIFEFLLKIFMWFNIIKTIFTTF